ncbi:hypothetical protein A3A66_01170 [Microgenomates group bacterium RIFCSPLOWO2_01_FULL_46_13]|nr:MAG: hypothetical protein A2783_01085 [Microgenomates group bacterium RIFCSPHIGHO2_01_FULL_45_11]OGV94615.1 MAG: hypothetical protein A3A66_01170 [Microgenomates group bacterium RIFCSPLOWO2_01_FULL_46_13]
MVDFLSRLFPQGLKNVFHFFIALGAVIYYRYPVRKLTVIGVTGTDGKTTTATLIYHILKTVGIKVALVSTVAAYLGDEKIDTGFHVTSPDPWSLQKLIKRIADEGFTHLVLEVTSHALDQHRLLGSNFKIGVVTNITHEHLDYHKTYEAYLAAKAKLFQKTRFSVLNATDKSFDRLKQLAQGKIISYSDEDVSQLVKQRFLEPYNQLNAQAAIAVVQLLDIDEITIQKGIESFPGVEGRMQEVKNFLGIKIVIDFAHTPNALEQALKSLRKQTQGRLIAVFGAAGKRDTGKRPLMGKVASELADEVVLTAEDPRGEDVNTIITQIKGGVSGNSGHMHGIVDRQEAINFAITKLARAGDTVGIFGKGHERSINLNGRDELPWSDIKVVQQALSLY